MCALYRGYNILPELMEKFGVQLIHGCDLYTSDYGMSIVVMMGKWSDDSAC